MAVMLAAGSALVATRARATTEAVVVVSTDDGSASAAPQIAHDLMAWGAHSGKYTEVDVATKVMGGGPATRAAAAATGAAKLKAGLAAYDALTYDTALTDLADAEQAYLSADARTHLKGLLDVYAARALALYYAGRVPDAKTQLVDIFALDKGYVFDKTRTTPEVQKLAEAVRATETKLSPADLEIQTSPAGAQVWVDGRYVGISPTEAKGLIPGNHLVTVVRTGDAFSQRQVVAAPGKIVQVDLKPAPGAAKLHQLLQGVKRGFASRTWSEPVAAVANWANADQVLAVAVRTGTESGLHLDAARVARDGHLLAVMSTHVQGGAGLDAAVAAFATRLHAKDLPRGPNGQPITTLGGFGSPQLYGAITGGVGVAAIVGAVIMGVTASGTAARARAVPQLDETLYKNTLGQARSQALVADVLYVIGAVGAGVGTWLFLKKPAGAAAPAPAPSGMGENAPFFSLAPVPLPGGAGLTVQGRF